MVEKAKTEDNKQGRYRPQTAGPGQATGKKTGQNQRGT